MFAHNTRDLAEAQSLQMLEPGLNLSPNDGRPVSVNLGEQNNIGFLFNKNGTVLNLPEIANYCHSIYFETSSGDIYRLNSLSIKTLPQEFCVTDANHGKELIVDSFCEDLKIDHSFRYTVKNQARESLLIKYILLLTRPWGGSDAEAVDKVAQGIITTFVEKFNLNADQTCQKVSQEFRRRGLGDKCRDPILQTAFRCYSSLLIDRYKEIREDRDGTIVRAITSGSLPHDAELDQYARLANDSIIAERSNNSPNFIFRRPINPCSDSFETLPQKMKVALSVCATKGLINALDTFVAKHKSVVYKVPNQDWGWERQDPVTIYLVGAFTDEIKQDLIQLVGPFTRDRYGIKSKLIGNVIHPGMALENNPSRDEIYSLLDKLGEFDPIAKLAAFELYTKNDLHHLRKFPEIKMSSGQFAACQWLAEFIA